MRIRAGSSFLPSSVPVHFSCSQSLRTHRANQTYTGRNREREDRGDNGRENEDEELIKIIAEGLPAKRIDRGQRLGDFSIFTCFPQN